MNDTDRGTQRAFDAFAQAQGEFSRRLLHEFGGGAHPTFATLFRHITQALAADPERVRAMQNRLYQDQWALWLRFFDAGPETATTTTEPDKRFSATEWRSLPWFDYLHQSYALISRWLNDLIETVQVDPAERRKLRFYARQWIDAMAPSNFASTNPEALKAALETQGESVNRGWTNLNYDLRKGRISMTDESAFEVGRNLALTPGAVIYRNELIELLQYRPLTAAVQQLPLVIVPPCINKYYILDLQQDNSFVRYAAEQGLTVFMISWRNIPPALGRLTWDDYLQDGVMRALEVARAICGVPKVNALGFCVGGTMLASALAVLRRKRRRPVAALTLLASMLDFSDPGDISVYVDRAYVERVEHDFRDGGVLPGERLASAFASLRANDLVWRYVVNNYLKGRTPPAFDLLYWNSDSANLPGPMYAYYVRHMYLENALRNADALTMCGVPVDLGEIDLPTYVFASVEDHIVPWETAHASAKLLGKRTEFVLGGSGHIAGVVNPASRDRRSFRTGPSAASAQQWLSASHEHPGSWWKHWAPWIKGHAGPAIAARTQLGNEKYAELEPAPGSYVRVRG